MKLFSYDSKFMKFLNTFFDVAWLNLLWFVCCLPLVTIGPATIAAYTVTLRVVEGTEGYIAKEFFKAFKENLKHGFALTFILAVPLYSAWISFQLFEKLDNHPFGFMLVSVLLAFIFVWHSLYIFPIEARYENTLRMNLINSRRMFMRFPLRSILLCAVLAFEAFILFYWCFKYQNTFSTVLMWIGILIGPMCMMMTISGMVMPLFRILDSDEADDDEPVNISVN